MGVWIVIAAYNEADSIAGVVSELRKNKYNNIIVVDDGSGDSTGKAAKNAGAIVLTHAINRGQGAALRTGIEYALEKGADIIVTFDADGQHRVEDVPAVIKPVKEGKADIAFGSRFLKKTKVPFGRKILLKGSVLILWLFYGIKMTDAHNGFRALSGKAARKISITCDRMAHASEIVEEVHRKRLRFREVPVTIRYTRESMKKGHGGFFGALEILYNMLVKKFLLR